LKIFQKLGWFFKLYRRRYIIAIILLIFVGLLEVVPPKMVGTAVDQIQQGTFSRRDLTQFLMIFAGIIVVSYVTTFYWMRNLFGGSFIVERLLRTHIMGHLLKMTPTFFERNRTGDLMARATNDLQAVGTTAGFGILTLSDSSAFLVTVLLTMGILISWNLTLAALLPLPFIAVTMVICGKMIHKRFTLAQDAFGDMNDQVLETISGVRVIRAYAQENADQQRFRFITDDVYRKNVAVTIIDSLFEPIIRLLVGASYLIGLGYGTYLVFHNQITLGDLVSFNVYLGMLIWPMFALGELINVMQRGEASLDRVNETLGYKPDVVDAQEIVRNANAGMIRFEQVTFRYPSSSTDNLTEISLKLPKGQTLGIVGKTGSGKTTILKQLLREYPSGSGEITIDNVSLKRIGIDQLHSWIGYVPQEPILFSRSVRDNLLFGKRDGDEEDIKHALEVAAFLKDMDVLSDGLETIVGEKGVSLSGGQKQRLSLARALIANPEILLMDDTLSAVDARTEAEIIRNIRNERVGKTTWITTHRFSAILHADWIVVLDQGKIIEQGTHEQLLDYGGWYKEQFERQKVEVEI